MAYKGRVLFIENRHIHTCQAIGEPLTTSVIIHSAWKCLVSIYRPVKLFSFSLIQLSGDVFECVLNPRNDH